MATTQNLIEYINSKIEHLTEEDVTEAVELILKSLKKELSADNRIEVRGFGSFSIRKRKMSNNKIYNTVYYRMSEAIVSKLNNN